MADADALADTLADVSTREARRFEAAGTALVGAPVPTQADTGTLDTDHTDTVLGVERNFYRFEVEPGTTVQADATYVGDPSYPGGTPGQFCPVLAITDSANENYDADTHLGDANDTAILQTNPVTIDDDEVWLKLATGCSNQRPDHEVAGLEFDVQFRLSEAS